MSSTVPSTKKTKTWRNKNLIPAGFIKLKDDAVPREGMAQLFELLEHNLAGGIGAVAGFMDLQTASSLERIAKKSSESASDGTADTWNETQWRRRCHGPMLQRLTDMFPQFSDPMDDLQWSSINVEERVTLLPHVPDFTVGFKPSLRNRDEWLTRQILDDLVAEIDPYINDSLELAYPFLSVECKSLFGVEFEAENQCGESSIKMLYKLRLLGGAAKNIPIISVTIIGYRALIYMACSECSSNGNINYYMQLIWSGRLSKKEECLIFHHLIYRYFKWVLGTFQPVVVNEIRQRCNTSNKRP